jgi:hypothetical protein
MMTNGQVFLENVREVQEESAFGEEVGERLRGRHRKSSSEDGGCEGAWIAFL